MSLSSSEKEPFISRPVTVGILGSLAIAGTITALLTTHKPENVPNISSVPAHAPTVPADTDANRALRAFPNTLKGAEKIEKYEIPGATKILVHIRQAHATDELLQAAKEGKETEELRQRAEMVITTQTNIDYILREMATRNMLTTLVPEGFVENSVSPYGSRPLGAISQEHKFEQSTPLREEKELQKIIQGLPQLLGHPVTPQQVQFFAYGAAASVAQDGLAVAVPGETLEQDILATMMPWTNGNTSDVFDGRENRVIQAAVTSASGTFAVVVMGGSHDFLGRTSALQATWSNTDYVEKLQYRNINVPEGTSFDIDPKNPYLLQNAASHIDVFRVPHPQKPDTWEWCGNQDNVAVWNNQHPDAKISVIVITPVGYQEINRASP